MLNESKSNKPLLASISNEFIKYTRAAINNYFSND